MLPGRTSTTKCIILWLCMISMDLATLGANNKIIINNSERYDQVTPRASSQGSDSCYDSFRLELGWCCPHQPHGARHGKDAPKMCALSWGALYLDQNLTRRMRRWRCAFFSKPPSFYVRSPVKHKLISKQLGVLPDEQSVPWPRCICMQWNTFRTENSENPTFLGQGGPRHSDNVSAKTCYTSGRKIIYRSRSRSDRSYRSYGSYSCRYEMLWRICMCGVQIQPRRHVLDHANRTAPIRQHELDHTDLCWHI